LTGKMLPYTHAHTQEVPQEVGWEDKRKREEKIKRKGTGQGSGRNVQLVSQKNKERKTESIKGGQTERKGDPR
jgi:hypothetical protein